MISRIICFWICTLIFFTACKNNALVKDTDYLNYIETGLDYNRNIAKNRATELFKAFSDTLSSDEEQAFRFLLAAMPLNDMADYSGEFFLANAKMSLKAREQYPWVKDLPDDIFLHFVLPLRVNNENLDSFRIKYYDELYNRLEHISDIGEAALEINHWCHEKVSYQSADIRTSAPESTMLSARGRCGEESTFTVAALRTAGIPARQVYVPRWAHSDDNHAWVEVWIDGSWNYMGACEPEAILNRGWFTESASRAMLVRTFTYGKYFGSEEVLRSTEHFSEINSLKHYTDLRNLTVIVTDASGNPVADAELSLLQFNYSEFFPLSVINTDENGICNISTASGDLVLWAEKDNDFGLARVSVSLHDSVVVTIGRESINALYNWDLTGPEVLRTNPDISKVQEEENKTRLRQEDSIRNAYISSWISKSEIESFAELNNYKPEEITPIIEAGMGNYSEIISFLQVVENKDKSDAIDLLNIIAEKDLSDTKAEVLLDHLLNARNFDVSEYTEDTFVKYILNPRIDNEIIRPWRKYIQSQQNSETIEAFRQDPTILSSWMNNNLQIRNKLNYYNVPITPKGVLDLGVTDQHSRDILFVACCRACGIAARLEPGTLYPQYMRSGKWNDVYFSDRGEIKALKAVLELTAKQNNPEPQYYKHFTIAKIENGNFKTLEFDYNKKVSDFDNPLLLSPGYYMLVTGNRLDDKLILSSTAFFSLKEGEKLTLDVSYREEIKEERNFGILSGDGLYDKKNKLISSKDIAENRAIIAWIDHEKEPSKHLLREIQELSRDFDKWNGSIVLVSDPENIPESLKLENYKSVPAGTIFAFDQNLAYLKQIFPYQDLDNSKLPLVIFVNNNLDIIYKSIGYKVGYGEELLKISRSQ